MEKIQKIDFHLDCFLLNHQGKASLLTYFNLMQEAALRHAKNLGFGKNNMESMGLFWVLTRMGLIIEKNTFWDDIITVTTWSRGVIGPYSYREFLFHNKKGELIAKASSSWALLSSKTRRPVILDKPEIVNDKSEPNLSNNIELIKISNTEINFTEQINHKVLNTDLDINGHANNAKYVEWIYNSLPLNFFDQKERIHFQINYLGEAHLNDSIVISNTLSEIGKTTYFQGINSSKQKTYFQAFVE
jgi:medium-chain acyl-[acyl-carrier-protein] hydrolase